MNMLKNMSEINFKSSFSPPSFTKSIKPSIWFEGGNVEFKTAELKREYIVSKDFLNSHRVKEIEFTNYVNKTGCDKFIKPIINLMDNHDYILTHNSEVIFDSYNGERLELILDHYAPKKSKKEREEQLYKVSPIDSILTGTLSDTVRIYLFIENDPNVISKYTFVFCDIYHLAIPSASERKSAITNRTNTYKQYSPYGFHLKDIISAATLF